MTIKHKIIKFASIGAMVISTLGYSYAADFPKRTLTVINPWGPGSGTMPVAQHLGDGMVDDLGQKIKLTFLKGANGTRAGNEVLRKKADGYTIFDGYVAPMIIAQQFGKASFTYKDFIPLHSATYNALALAIRKDETRFTNLKELIAYMKKNPKKLKYSGNDQLGLPHLVAARMFQKNNAVAVHVPYDGMDKVWLAVRQGVLDFAIINLSIYKKNKSTMKIAGVLTELKGAKEFYEGAPLVTEMGIDTGLTGLGSVGWTWWVVKKGTPDHVVKKLRDAMATSKANPEVKRKINEIGFDLLPYSADQYEEVMSKATKQLKGAVDAIEWEDNQNK